MCTAAMSCLTAGLFSLPLQAQEWTTRLHKPKQKFFFYQFNVAGGYDSQEPNSFGFADRGPKTQFTLEWYGKDESRIQQGYTRFMTPSSWNLKFGMQLNPFENDGGRASADFRLFDAWVRLSTKWDRTSLWIGHRSLPYGHNPRLDPDLNFLPNQSSMDLGFGRDTGVFLRLPVTSSLDLEASATMGGFLSGRLFSLQDGADDEFGIRNHLDYRGTWLATFRLGNPTFKRSEYGLFGAVGVTQSPADQPLTRVSRVGVDWVYKFREHLKAVSQFSVGRNDRSHQGQAWVASLLNSMEFYPVSRLMLGLTNTYRVENPDQEFGNPQKGTLFSTVSFSLTRLSRLRLNPFMEYRDTSGERDWGVLLQYCIGCGLRK